MEFAALQRGMCAISHIHQNASTQGRPTSSAVQVNLGNFIAGYFTVEFPANRVRGATASGYVAVVYEGNWPSWPAHLQVGLAGG